MESAERTIFATFLVDACLDEGPIAVSGDRSSWRGWGVSVMISDARCTSADTSLVVRTGDRLGRWEVQSNDVAALGDGATRVLGNLASAGDAPHAEAMWMMDGDGTRIVGHGSWWWSLSTDDMIWSPEIFPILGIDATDDVSRPFAALSAMCERVEDLRTIAEHVLRTGRRFEGTQSIVVS
ncbi:MAG: hypothetical protein AB7V43_14315, partial [Acidimicrobiia bacterium]